MTGRKAKLLIKDLQVEIAGKVILIRRLI